MLTCGGCPAYPQQQAQYLHQFVLHASLDAVDEAMWNTKELHLKVLLQWDLVHASLLLLLALIDSYSNT